MRAFSAFRRDHLALAVFALALALAPTLADRAVGLVAPAPEPESLFDPGPILRIDALLPEYYLIGNSMLNTRIDVQHLTKRFGALAILHPDTGVMSASWYLQLKNHVMAAAHKPRVVFIFFRDTNLTEPKKRTKGKYARMLRIYRHTAEPEYLAILAGHAGSGLLDHLRFLYTTGVPGMIEMPNLEHWLADAPGKLAAILVAGSDRDWRVLPDAVNASFAGHRFRSLADAADDEPEAGDENSYDFAAAVEDSFLPPMLDMAAEGRFKLCFVRVKTRDVAMGMAPDPRIERYTDDLRTYLESRGACLIDMSREPRVIAEWFSDGDHIRDDRRRVYTDVFYEAVTRTIE
jgi:hypothetical protein